MRLSPLLLTCSLCSLCYSRVIHSASVGGNLPDSEVPETKELLSYEGKVASEGYGPQSQTAFRNDGAGLPSGASAPYVSLPVDNPTKSFWLDTPGANPLAEYGSIGVLTPEADVCIVGSGMTGVSAAWHLTQTLKDHLSQTSVVVLEARQFCSAATGRNGGHLTHNIFNNFIAIEDRYNTSEAVRSVLIEKHTADALVQFLKDRNLEDTVDLFEGGHVAMFRTKEEESAARDDFQAAKAAGVDVSTVNWIDHQELVEQYGLNQKLDYTAVKWIGHNLWPCKLVTELFRDAQTSSDNVNVALHTKTPVTAITRRFLSRRRWAAHTPRGDVACSYIVHATNAYAGHLLPFFAGDAGKQEPLENKLGGGGGGHEEPPPSHPRPKPHPHPHQPNDPSHNRTFGITPTRGQVRSIRASVSSKDLRWHNSWDGGGGGWEYWFPRLQGVDENDPPLIILGGGREHSGGNLEAGVTDDANVNEKVGEKLGEFLPGFFPEEFKQEPADGSKDVWEMEWTGIMGYTKTGDPFVGPVVPPHDSEELVNSYEGQYIAAGYTGHGMPRAYACAEAVAGMIKAKIAGKKWEIPEWLPMRYLTSSDDA